MGAANQRPKFLTSGHFEVSIDNDEFGGAAFREIDGMSASVEVLEYQEGGENTKTHKIFGQTRFSNIILRKGMVAGHTKMWDWIKKAIDGTVERRNGEIRIRDQGGNPKMKIIFKNAFPCGWRAPTLDAGDAQLGVEELEIAHEGLEFKKYEGGGGGGGGGGPAVQA